MNAYWRPKTILQALHVPRTLLGFSGLCPYSYNMEDQTFYFCWYKMLITIAHVSTYTYLQLIAILYDFDDYKQPVLATSWITTQINFIIKLLGIVITFSVVTIRLVSVKDLKDQLNGILKAVKLYEEIGDNLHHVYHKLQIIMYMVVFWCFGFLFFSVAHSFYFFKVTTGREPKLTLKCLIILSYFYKSVFLGYVWCGVLQVYYLTRSTNNLMQRSLNMYKENEKAVTKTDWFPKNFDVFE